MKLIILLLIICPLFVSCQSMTKNYNIEKYNIHGSVIEKEKGEIKQEGWRNWGNKERVFDIRILNFGI